MKSETYISREIEKVMSDKRTKYYFQKRNTVNLFEI